MSTSSDDGKLLAVYLLSCEHGTMAGVCRLTDGYVSDDLNWQPERVAEGFDELSRKGFATRCATTNWVWVVGFLEDVAYNPNQWKAARKIAASVPVNCSWRAAFQEKFAVAAGDLKPKGSETVPLGSPSGTVGVSASAKVSASASAKIAGSASDATALRHALPESQSIRDGRIEKALKSDDLHDFDDAGIARAAGVTREEVERVRRQA
jgi:hypothetical protein